MSKKRFQLTFSLMTVLIITFLIVMITQISVIKINPTLAQNYPKVDCVNPQTTSDMNYCSQQELKTADQKLNQNYQALTKRLSKTQKQKLVLTQQAWIKFRDLTCDYEKGQFEGGTLATSTYNYCLARITQQRVTDLENYLRQANL